MISLLIFKRRLRLVDTPKPFLSLSATYETYRKNRNHYRFSRHSVENRDLFANRVKPRDPYPVDRVATIPVSDRLPPVRATSTNGAANSRTTVRGPGQRRKTSRCQRHDATGGNARGTHRFAREKFENRLVSKRSYFFADPCPTWPNSRATRTPCCCELARCTILLSWRSRKSTAWTFGARPGIQSAKQHDDFAYSLSTLKHFGELWGRVVTRRSRVITVLQSSRLFAV